MTRATAAELEMPRRRPGALRGPAASQAALDAEQASCDAALAVLQARVAAIARGEERGTRTAASGLTSLRRRYARLERERWYAAEQARRLGRRR
jgi:hypothetical protein